MTRPHNYKTSVGTLQDFTTRTLSESHSVQEELLRSLVEGCSLEVGRLTILGLEVQQDINTDSTRFRYTVLVHGRQQETIDIEMTREMVLRLGSRGIFSRLGPSTAVEGLIPHDGVTCSRCKAKGLTHYRTGKTTKRILCDQCFSGLLTIGAVREGGDIDGQEIRQDHGHEKELSRGGTFIPPAGAGQAGPSGS